MNLHHRENFKYYVLLASSIFWDKTPWSPLKANRHFGGTWHLQHEAGKKSIYGLSYQF
jgi:hypothetical protein